MNEGSLRRAVESKVNYYGSKYPIVFSSAKGSWLFARNGERFLDFFSAAGSLNYGHNHPVLMEAVLEYMTRNGVVQSLDLHTEARTNFLDTLERTILSPRNLDWRVQFPGPTGTNAIEAGLKLAQKVTGKTGFLAATGGFHGMTLGAMSISDRLRSQEYAELGINDLRFVEFVTCSNDRSAIDSTLNVIESHQETVAAFIVETVQGEGGLSVASEDWIRDVAVACRDAGILLFIDDIQAGCGRTGSFFSFDHVGIEPDIVAVSKSLSGIGTPFSALLFKRELDTWSPGEHSGTFRGNNIGFVSGAVALNEFWNSGRFAREIGEKSASFRDALFGVIRDFDPSKVSLKGTGFMTGYSFADAELANAIREMLFGKNVICETCGPDESVLKLFPPLNAEWGELEMGVNAIESAFNSVANQLS